MSSFPIRVSEGHFRAGAPCHYGGWAFLVRAGRIAYACGRSTEDLRAAELHALAELCSPLGYQRSQVLFARGEPARPGRQTSPSLRGSQTFLWPPGLWTLSPAWSGLDGPWEPDFRIRISDDRMTDVQGQTGSHNFDAA